MSSLTCRAIRMTSIVSGRARSARLRRLPGGLADVVADLAQRPRRLVHRGRSQLEHVHLAGPDPHLDGHTRRGQQAGGLARVVEQNLGPDTWIRVRGRPGSMWSSGS